jgi:hypothetical protein
MPKGRAVVPHRLNIPPRRSGSFALSSESVSIRVHPWLRFSEPFAFFCGKSTGKIHDIRVIRGSMLNFRFPLSAFQILHAAVSCF